MKTKLYLACILALPAVLFSCSDKIEDTFIVNEPVYMTYDDLRNSFKTTESQEIIQPGKIYFKDDYIFINEYQEGIHIVDNSNPSSPEVIKFIEIPGNIDMAVRENILYADSYVDLVAIDISDINNIVEVNRVENVFPYMVPFYEVGILEEVDQAKGIVVGWKETVKTVEVTDIGNPYWRYPMYENDFLVVDAGFAGDNRSASKSGVGGSMARFTLYDEYLYTVDQSILRLFDVSSSADPSLIKQIGIGWNIETLFPYQDKLFIGSTTGMYIYSLSDPLNPKFISIFRHVSRCDPVVVEGNYAYVTLRAGNLCGDAESQLDVIDISDIYDPELLMEYPMEEPYGLGIDNNILFVCDGDAGLKIYDARDPYEIDKHQIAVYSEINAFDVIPLGEVLIMIGTTGLFQYDYSDPENISLLSQIPIIHLRQ